MGKRGKNARQMEERRKTRENRRKKYKILRNGAKIKAKDVRGKQIFFLGGGAGMVFNRQGGGGGHGFQQTYIYPYSKEEIHSYTYMNGNIMIMNALRSRSPSPLSDGMSRQTGKCIAVLYLVDGVGEAGMASGRNAFPHSLHHVPRSHSAPHHRHKLPPCSR
jgi:hypothetical protein